MPPALSDYDSDSDFDCHPAASTGVEEVEDSTPCDAGLEEHSEGKEPRAKVRAAVARVVSRKRKRNPVLDGLDLDNILAIPDDEDCLSVEVDPLGSSIPTSSYRTRGQTHSKQKSELCYDQKYHPMDDFLRPARAAQRKAKHEDLAEDSSATIFDGGEHSDSCSDVQDHPQSKKRKKKSSPPRSQGTRRSSRKVNRDVFYNAEVHPQDAELEQMDEDVYSEEAHFQEISSEELQGQDVQNEGAQFEEELSGSQRRNEMDGADGTLEIRDTEDETDSEQSASSPLKSSPLSSIGLVPTPASGIRPNTEFNPRAIVVRDRPSARTMRSLALSFSIYQEPLSVQLAREATAPPPIELPDDNKENISPTGSDFEQTPRRDVMLQPLAERSLNSLGDLENAEIDSDINQLLSDFTYVEASTGTSPYFTVGDAAFDEDGELAGYYDGPGFLFYEDNRDEYDSVLGYPSSQPTSDVGSVLGEDANDENGPPPFLAFLERSTGTE